MDRGELFDSDSNIVLDDEALRAFTKDNIWPTAIYYWGTDFGNPNGLDENQDVYIPKISHDASTD